MTAGQQRASISTTLVFADLRRDTNELVEAHQYSILADDIQQDCSVLLSSYESTFLARSEATREPALLISSKSNLPFLTSATRGAVRMRIRQIQELPDFIC